MDTTFCNLLNIWVKVFGTYLDKNDEIPIEYDFNRKMNPNNFPDVYFGEFAVLFRGLKNAPGLKNKFLYLVIHPVWAASACIKLQE